VYHEYVSGAITPFGIDFDVFVYKRKELYGMLVGAFEKHGLLATLVRTHSLVARRAGLWLRRLTNECRLVEFCGRIGRRASRRTSFSTL